MDRTTGLTRPARSCRPFASTATWKSPAGAPRGTPWGWARRTCWRCGTCCAPRPPGEQAGPKDLSRILGITTASTTSLIDRLVSSGHVRREPHPTDRRSLVIVPTAATDAEVRATLGDMHRRMMAVAEELSDEEARTVVRFLRRMSEAIAEPTSHGGN